MGYMLLRIGYNLQLSSYYMLMPCFDINSYNMHIRMSNVEHSSEDVSIVVV